MKSLCLILLFSVSFPLHGYEVNQFPYDFILSCDDRLLGFSSSGEVVWSYEGDESNPLSRATTVSLLEDRTLLVAGMFSVRIINFDGTICWSYQIPRRKRAGRITGCQDLGNGKLLILSEADWTLTEWQKGSGADYEVLHQLSLEAFKIEDSPHGRFRGAFKLNNEQYLLTDSFGKKIYIIDREGEVIKSLDQLPMTRVFGAVPSSNQHLLVAHPYGPTGLSEVDQDGAAVWQLTDDDLPAGVRLGLIYGFQKRPNGNLVVVNSDFHVNHPNPRKNFPLLEMNREKELQRVLTFEAFEGHYGQEPGREGPFHHATGICILEAGFFEGE